MEYQHGRVLHQGISFHHNCTPAGKALMRRVLMTSTAQRLDSELWFTRSPVQSRRDHLLFISELCSTRAAFQWGVARSTPDRPRGREVAQLTRKPGKGRPHGSRTRGLIVSASRHLYPPGCCERGRSGRSGPFDGRLIAATCCCLLLLAAAAVLLWWAT